MVEEHLRRLFVAVETKAMRKGRRLEPQGPGTSLRQSIRRSACGSGIRRTELRASHGRHPKSTSSRDPHELSSWHAQDWGRFSLDVLSNWGRHETNVISLRGRFRVDLESIWSRVRADSGVDPGFWIGPHAVSDWPPRQRFMDGQWASFGSTRG